MLSDTMTDVLSPEIIRLDVPPPRDTDELFSLVAGTLAEAGRVRDSQAFIRDLRARELEGSTYMGNGTAVPHTRSAGVAVPSVCIYRLARPMHYVSHGEEGEVDQVFVIAMPEDSGDEHLAVLARLARALVDEDLIASFRAAHDPAEVARLFAARTRRARR